MWDNAIYVNPCFKMLVGSKTRFVKDSKMHKNKNEKNKSKPNFQTRNKTRLRPRTRDVQDQNENKSLLC
jgi:hypothetical protein